MTASSTLCAWQKNNLEFMLTEQVAHQVVVKEIFMQLHCIFRTLFLSVVSVMLAACATTTNVDYREGYDFSAIGSVQVARQAQSVSRDTRVNSPLVDARIRKAIVSQLAARGIAIVAGKADAMLVYQVDTRSSMESYGSGYWVGYGRYSSHSAAGIGYGFPAYDVESYDEIVITIDFIDVTENTMLWRGSDSERLYDGSTPETMDNMVNGLVEDILVNYPPERK
jgi:hypothetical protein